MKTATLLIVLLSFIATLLADDHAGHGVAAQPAGIASLDVYADGDRLHVLLVDRQAGKPAQLQHVQSLDGGKTWSPPTAIETNQPPPESAKRSADVQIAAAGDRVVAVWTTPNTDDRFNRGPLAVAISGDGGKTWSAGANPADDGAAIGHAFIDVAADVRGEFHVVWLDSRDDTPATQPTAAHDSTPTSRSIAARDSTPAPQPIIARDVAAEATSAGEAESAGAAKRRPGTAAATAQTAPDQNAVADRSVGKGLRYARSTDCGRSWSANVTIDAATCECCWNRIVPAGEKLYVLYRDIAPRDMAMAVSSDHGNTWRRAGSVGAFGWNVNLCPHVGGGLVVDGDDVNAVVYTGKSPTNESAGPAIAAALDGQTFAGRGVYFLHSRDGGDHFAEPRVLGDANAWKPDLAAGDGKLVAAWDARIDGQLAAFWSSSSDGGATWSPPAQLNAAGTSAAVPRAVHSSHGFMALWTESAKNMPAVWRSGTLP